MSFVLAKHPVPRRSCVFCFDVPFPLASLLRRSILENCCTNTWGQDVKRQKVLTVCGGVWSTCFRELRNKWQIWQAIPRPPMPPHTLVAFNHDIVGGSGPQNKKDDVQILNLRWDSATWYLVASSFAPSLLLAC